MSFVGPAVSIFTILCVLSVASYELHGRQLVEYRVDDWIAINVILRNIPTGVESAALINTNNGVYGVTQNVMSTIKFEKISSVLLSWFSNTTLNARLYLTNGSYIEKEVFKCVLREQPKPHICKKECTIVIDDWNQEASGNQKNRTDKSSVEHKILEYRLADHTKEIDTKLKQTVIITSHEKTNNTKDTDAGKNDAKVISGTNQNTITDYSYLYLIIGIGIFVILALLLYYIVLKKIKKSPTINDTYTYTTAPQVSYADLQLDPLPKSLYAERIPYTYVIGELRPKLMKQ